MVIHPRPTSSDSAFGKHQIVDLRTWVRIPLATPNSSHRVGTAEQRGVNPACLSTSSPNDFICIGRLPSCSLNKFYTAAKPCRCFTD
jgi:hypothetical protein